MWYELQIRMKALWLSDCKVLVGHYQCSQHIYLLDVDSWDKNEPSKVVRENKAQEKLLIWEHYLFLSEKKGASEAWEVCIGGHTSTPLSGEGLMQILATHIRLAAENHIHFAIFFLWYIWPCPQVLGIGKPFY